MGPREKNSQGIRNFFVSFELAKRTKYAGRRPMLAWAIIIALATGVLFYVLDPSVIIVNVAELAGVIALFTLVCAAEAFSEPKGESRSK